MMSSYRDSGEMRCLLFTRNVLVLLCISVGARLNTRFKRLRGHSSPSHDHVPDMCLAAGIRT